MLSNRFGIEIDSRKGDCRQAILNAEVLPVIL